MNKVNVQVLFQILLYAFVLVVYVKAFKCSHKDGTVGDFV